MAFATLADLKQYLGISATTDDALLTACLARATAAIEVYTGRTFYAASATARKLDAIADVDGRRLLLGDDCASITSVVNGDGSTVTTAQYVTEPRNAAPYYALTLLASTGLSWTYDDDPENAISVTAYWAYSITPPANIVQACVRWAGHLYRMKDAQVYDALQFADQGAITVNPGIPKDVLTLIDPYRRRI